MIIIFLCFVCSCLTVYAISQVIVASADVSYDGTASTNLDSDNVQDAIDELYADASTYNAYKNRLSTAETNLSNLYDKSTVSNAVTWNSTNVETTGDYAAAFTMKKYGKIRLLYLYFKTTSDIGASGWQTVGTIASGHRPAMDYFGPVGNIVNSYADRKIKDFRITTGGAIRVLSPPTEYAIYVTVAYIVP